MAHLELGGICINVSNQMWFGEANLSHPSCKTATDGRWYVLGCQMAKTCWYLQRMCLRCHLLIPPSSLSSSWLDNVGDGCAVHHITEAEDRLSAVSKVPGSRSGQTFTSCHRNIFLDISAGLSINLTSVSVVARSVCCWCYFSLPDIHCGTV